MPVHSHFSEWCKLGYGIRVNKIRIREAKHLFIFCFHIFAIANGLHDMCDIITFFQCVMIHGYVYISYCLDRRRKFHIKSSSFIPYRTPSIVHRLHCPSEHALNNQNCRQPCNGACHTQTISMQHSLMPRSCLACQHSIRKRYFHANCNLHAHREPHATSHISICAQMHCNTS